MLKSSARDAPGLLQRLLDQLIRRGSIETESLDLAAVVLPLAHSQMLPLQPGDGVLQSGVCACRRFRLF